MRHNHPTHSSPRTVCSQQAPCRLSANATSPFLMTSLSSPLTKPHGPRSYNRLLPLLLNQPMKSAKPQPNSLFSAWLTHRELHARSFSRDNCWCADRAHPGRNMLDDKREVTGQTPVDCFFPTRLNRIKPSAKTIDAVVKTDAL